MQAYINYAIINQDVDLTELINTDDVEVNSYLRYCQDLTDKLRQVRTQYNKDSDFKGDIEEFKIYIMMPLKFLQYHLLGQDLIRDYLLLSQIYFLE